MACDRGTNRCVGASYDQAGNLTGKDNFSLAYDAENRQPELSVDGTTFKYHYDGEGRRVKKEKTAGTPWRVVYVYDAFGNLAAEYSTLANTVSGTRWITADHLGSTRMVTDDAGGEVEVNVLIIC